MMYLALAWRNTWRNRRRTLITIASVFFALVLAIIMRSATTGVYERMVHNVVSFSSGYIQVHSKGYWEERSIDNSFPESTAIYNVINKTEGVSAYVPRLESFALASSGPVTKGVMVIGIDPEREKMLTRVHEKVLTGGYVTPGDNGVLVGEGVASTLGIKVKDTLILIGQGYHGASAAAMFPVKGILQLGSPDLSKRIVYLPLEQARQMYDAPGLLSSVSLMLHDPSAADEVVEELRSSLDTSRYEVMTWKEMMPELDQLIEADKAGHTITIGVLYLVISFGVFGTILMMTAERTHELGILLAIGMKRGLLSFVLLLEVLFIALLATLFGTLVSIPLLNYYSKHPLYFSGKIAEAYERFGMEPVIALSTAPSVFISQAIVVFLISFVLGLYPFFRIQRLEAVKAIHS